MGNTRKSLASVLVLSMALSSFLLIYSVPVGLAQSVNASPTFTITIVASINNYSSTCVFGINPDSSTTYSPKYDSYASYPSSGGVYAYLRYYNSTTFRTDKLSQYIVPSNGSTTWHLEVESIDQEGILTINWSSGTSFGSLIFEDGIINRIVYADMNAVGNFSYRAYPGSVSDFDIVYQSATPTLTATPTLSPAPSLGELPYVVVTLIPTPYSTDVPLNTTIAISFSRLPPICDLSVTPNVAIKEKVVKSELYGGLDTIYFLIDQLEPKTTYTAIVTYGQETAPEGYRPTTNRTWQFTTGTSINPPLSPSPIISPSPTQQPSETPPPIPTPSVEFIPAVDYVPALIMWGMLALTIALVAVGYFYFKRKGML